MFDIIGNRKKAVAIIDKEEKAEDILKKHKNVKSVLLKLTGRTGKYRTYKMKLVKGKRNTEVIHKEYGYSLKLDPKKVYFSPREAEERQRISKKVKSGERILIMFSGVSAFAIAIAKKKNSDIICIEINKKAVEYADENTRINKLKGRIENINADIRKVYKKLGKFDRILMPLPESAYKYLDTAFFCSKKNTIIHLYGISDENNFKDLVEKVKKHKKKIRILRKQKVLPFGVRMYKIRLDIKLF